ncbi:MAG: alanine/glycine:cation symporter family protein [Faecousia sp.]
MNMLECITALNRHVIWGMPMVLLMLGTGLFLTLITRAVLFTRFPIVMRCTLKTLFRSKEEFSAREGAITPFQAVCTALAATVGTGNIMGVALSIAAGGPGSVFWLWISALVGMVIKYGEVTLSVAYREVNHRGNLVGGPMYYIARGLGARWQALLFAAFGALAAFGIGASVQANALSVSLTAVFDLSPKVIGLVVTLLGGLVLLGGIRRIAAVSELLVPFMALFYIGGALVVLCINIRQVPRAFAMIFRDAFTGTAAIGGFLGSTAMQACRIGISRGVFTHEAGMGSAPIAHASAGTDHPARQGLWGAFEVFFDSIVMCTITALVILTSGLWQAVPRIEDGNLCAAAFELAFPGGRYLVTMGLVLFSFATIIAWYYYGETCLEYLLPDSGIVRRVYQGVYVAAIYLGCTATLDMVWAFADLCNGLMALPNLVALIALAPVIRNFSMDFFSDPHRIRAKDTDYSHLMR